MKPEYEFILTSYPDCEDFVVEIWFKNNLIAIVTENSEVRHVNNPMYPAAFDDDEFVDAINRAKEMLI